MRLKLKDLGQLVAGNPAYPQDRKQMHQLVAALTLSTQQCASNLCTVNTLLAEFVRLGVLNMQDVLRLARSPGPAHDLLRRHLTNNTQRSAEDVFDDLLRVFNIPTSAVTLNVLMSRHPGGVGLRSRSPLLFPIWEEASRVDMPFLLGTHFAYLSLLLNAG